MFPKTVLGFFCSISLTNITGNLIDYIESVDFFGTGHFNINFLILINIFPLFCIFFTFFYQCLVIFQCIGLSPPLNLLSLFLGILFEAIVNGVVFLVSLFDGSLIVYKHNGFLYIDFVCYNLTVISLNSF